MMLRWRPVSILRNPFHKGRVEVDLSHQIYP